MFSLSVGNISQTDFFFIQKRIFMKLVEKKNGNDKGDFEKKFGAQ
jgi:hypothetical protein